MKFVLGLCLLLLALSVEAGKYRTCPTSREGCAYTFEFDPVCSTLGCTYSNLGHMKCSGGKFWYPGECQEPHTGGISNSQWNIE